HRCQLPARATSTKLTAVQPRTARAREGVVSWLKRRYVGGHVSVDAPLRMRLPIERDPAPEEPAVAVRSHAALLIERHQQRLQARQVVERHAGEVVMLEVVVREEVDGVPEK